MRDYFISYTSKDIPWADWLAWELEAMGLEVLLQRWDFAPGSNFVIEMQRAVVDCKKLLLILSNASITSGYVDAEWAAFFASDPTGKDRRLIPVRIDDSSPPGLLAQISYIDLCDTTEEEARTRLNRGLSPGRQRPEVRPTFPGLNQTVISHAPRFPLQSPSEPRASESSIAGALALEQRPKLPSIRRRQQGRAFATQQMPGLLHRMMQAGRQISLVAIDVDGMKGLNGKFGLEVGDTVMERLTFFAEQIPNRFLVARMGDDTLLVVLRDHNQDQAMESAESLVAQIRAHDWGAIAGDLFVHCSAGVSQYGPQEDDSFEPIQRVLYAMREARRQGGNRVVSERSMPQELLNRARLLAKYHQAPTT